MLRGVGVLRLDTGSWAWDRAVGRLGADRNLFLQVSSVILPPSVLRPSSALLGPPSSVLFPTA
eukprot:5717107-Pyramimonas_sp.AAC.1